MSEQTPDDLMYEVTLEELRNRLKSDPVKVAKMWMRFLAAPMLALVGLISVAAINIPTFTRANEHLMDTLATMQPWETVQHPSWSIYEDSATPPNQYLNMQFAATAFYKRLLSLGWTNDSTEILVRVRVPNATAGEPDIKYYSSWITTTSPTVTDGKFTLRFSAHNLPPAGPPNGALVSGADYQAEIRFTMGWNTNYYREFVITTDWYTYVSTP